MLANNIETDVPSAAEGNGESAETGLDLEGLKARSLGSNLELNGSKVKRRIRRGTSEGRSDGRHTPHHEIGNGNGVYVRQPSRRTIAMEAKLQKLETEINKLINQDKEEDVLEKKHAAPAPAPEDSPSALKTPTPFTSTYVAAPDVVPAPPAISSPPKSRRLSPTKPEPSESQANPDEPGDFKIQCINLPIIIIYYCANADVKGPWPAIRWMLGGLFIALVDLVVLIALSITNQWPSCSSHDDCSLGTACIHLGTSSDGEPKHPKCFDCC